MRSHSGHGSRKARPSSEQRSEAESESRFVVKRKQDSMDDFLL